MDRLITPAELGARLGLASGTIYNKRARGEDLPPAINFGRRVRYRLSEVEAWLEARRETPASAAVAEALKTCQVAPTPKERTKEQADLDLWLAECCERHWRHEALSSDLYASFQQWKERRCERAPSIRAFSMLLQQKAKKRRTRCGRVFEGLRLRPVQDPAAT